MVDPVTAMEIISTIAAEPVKQQIRKRTFARRVAVQAAKEGRQGGIDVSARAIAGWLRREDTRKLLETGRADLFQPAVNNLALRLGGPEHASAAASLLPIVLRQAQLALDVNEAIVNSESRVSARFDTVDESMRAVLERHSAGDRLAENLRKLHPLHATPAAQISDTWPVIAEIVQLLAEAPAPAVILDEWARTEPRILIDAPASAYAWLGDVAADYEAGDAAVQFYGEAIQRGAGPRDYFLARSSLAIALSDPTRSRELITSAGRSEPLSDALARIHSGDLAGALVAMDGWQPSAARDAAVCVVLHARVLIELGRENEAVHELTSAADAEPSAAGVAIAAAVYLARRARFGVAASPYGDLDKACQLALRARNARRLWRGDSAAAVVVAMGAIATFGDPARAIHLATPAPEGDATPEEAADEAVLHERAVLVAMSAPMDVASAAAQGITEQHYAALIAGLVALRKDDVTGGTRLLLDAYEAAADDGDRIRAARLLAVQTDEVPDMSDLETRQPEAVKEIHQLHAALRPGPDRMSRLRAHQHENPQIAISLAEAYESAGQDVEAADTLEHAGLAFALPGLTVQAARKRLKLDDAESAIKLCESAIAMGGQRWPGEFSARVCLFEIFWGQGRFHDALQQARALVALDSADRDAAWALVRTHVQLGDLGAAWEALGVFGEPIAPRTAAEARLWVLLVMRSPRATALISRALEVIREWSDHPELNGAFVGSLTMFLPKEGLDAADQEAVRAVLADLLADEQAGDTGLVSIAVEEGEDPLKNLIPILKDRHERVADLGGQVARGELPVGMLTLVSSTMTEVLLQRYAGKVYGYSDHGAAQRANAVDAALDGRCVVDLTAIATLSLLDESTASELLSRFSELLSTYEQFGDALNAQIASKVHASGAMAWDPETQRARFTQIDEADAASLEHRADRVVELLRRTRRHAHKGLDRLQEFQELQDAPGVGAWIGPADMAAALDLPLWCDDVILSQVVSSLGVRTFGTVDLIRRLRGQGSLTGDLVDVTEAVLVHNYYVDLGFRREVQTHAAELANWTFAGAAYSMSRPAAWLDPDAAMSFIKTALSHATDPQAIEGWIAASATGLTASLDMDRASANLRILLVQLLVLPSIRLDHVPFVLKGVRAPIADSPGLEDPLESTLRVLHSALVEKHGPQAAQVLLLGLLGQASQADRDAAARVILTAP